MEGGNMEGGNMGETTCEEATCEEATCEEATCEEATCEEATWEGAGNMGGGKVVWASHILCQYMATPPWSLCHSTRPSAIVIMRCPRVPDEIGFL